MWHAQRIEDPGHAGRRGGCSRKPTRTNAKLSHTLDDASLKHPQVTWHSRRASKPAGHEVCRQAIFVGVSVRECVRPHYTSRLCATAAWGGLIRPSCLCGPARQEVGRGPGAATLGPAPLRPKSGTRACACTAAHRERRSTEAMSMCPASRHEARTAWQAVQAMTFLRMSPAASGHVAAGPTPQGSALFEGKNTPHSGQGSGARRTSRRQMSHTLSCILWEVIRKLRGADRQCRGTN